MPSKLINSKEFQQRNQYSPFNNNNINFQIQCDEDDNVVPPTTATTTTFNANQAILNTKCQNNRRLPFKNLNNSTTQNDELLLGQPSDSDGIHQFSELLLKDSHSCEAILNAGEDDEMEIIGYTRSTLKTIFCWLFIILTGGLLRLILYWLNHWYLLATHTKCSLETAEKILIREDYQGKHKVYYVKQIVTLNADTLREMKDTNSKLQHQFPYDGQTDDQNQNQNFYLSLHFSSGNFRKTDSIRLFQCKQLRYLWDLQTTSFQKLQGLDTDIPINYLHQRKGLQETERSARRIVYGINEISVPIKTTLQLLILEILNPFYVFQIFSVCLWLSYNYYYYAVVIVLMTVFGITMSIRQTRKNQNALRNKVLNNDRALVLNESGETESADTKYLVPGDIIEIPSTGCLMHCDAVLLSGNCILDESILTGESVPVTKTPLPMKKDLLFDSKEHARHTLFCGTKVMQTRYIGTEKVLAIVVNTGNKTAKGGLIRSILYPPPVDYKFEQDSYKFITFLSLIAGIGFVYTLVSKITRAVSAGKIAIEALDIITIVVPPALPAAMTVGRMNAQKRLKHQDIYCISPRSINVSGSVDCVCFDKTGTLTEDGLDMWGVVPKTETNQFQMPLKDIQRLPIDHLLFGMVTCHSITTMEGVMRGDPLDLKMFESTGWILEEANVADDNKYDLLCPTTVRQPKLAGLNGYKHESSTSLYLQQAAARSSEEDFFSNSIGILREFSFTSSLQRMSVITRRLGDDHFNAYTKGSPEMIQTLCRRDTVPENYLNQLDIYAQQGYRIISVAYKPLDKKMTYTRVQRIARDKIESELQFLGFVILENRLKPDTTDVINSLTTAQIRTVMVTGDNILTALSVAKDCGMIAKQQSVVTVNVRPLGNDKHELYYNLTGAAGIVSNGDDGNHTDLTSLESVSSLETTCSTLTTHFDVEAGLPEKKQRNDFLADNIITDQFHDNYRFAMVGKTWQIVRDEFEDKLPLFVTRGTIFARMSPDQKQSLIQELQALGYYVAMCGDGANDCGALKAAHTGISLSEAESSVASPFTSKKPTIACVPNVIREGRAALVTSFGIFKYMAAYSLVQFISVLILYSIDSNLTDTQFLYIDLFLISIFAFFFGRTGAYEGPLVKQAPLNSLVSLSPIASILLHLAGIIGFDVAGWHHLQSQDWFRPFNLTAAGDNDVENLACYENYTIFIISCYQYIILAFVFSKGAPYRKSILSNKPFLATLLINLLFVVYLTIEPHYFFINMFELIMPVELNFRLYLLAYGFCNFLLSLFIEMIIIELILFKKFQKRFAMRSSDKKYLHYELEMRENLDWPKLSEFSNLIEIDGEKQSPLSYAEISAEHNVNSEMLAQNSVLNSFFSDLTLKNINNENNDVCEMSKNDKNFSAIDLNNQNLRLTTNFVNSITKLDATDTLSLDNNSCISSEYESAENKSFNSNLNVIDLIEGEQQQNEKKFIKSTNSIIELTMNPIKPAVTKLNKSLNSFRNENQDQQQQSINSTSNSIESTTDPLNLTELNEIEKKQQQQQQQIINPTNKTIDLTTNSINLTTKFNNNYNNNNNNNSAAKKNFILNENTSFIPNGTNDASGGSSSSSYYEMKSNPTKFQSSKTDCNRDYNNDLIDEKCNCNKTELNSLKIYDNLCKLCLNQSNGSNNNNNNNSGGSSSSSNSGSNIKISKLLETNLELDDNNKLS